jgi:hypothetical protein
MVYTELDVGIFLSICNLAVDKTNFKDGESSYHASFNPLLPTWSKYLDPAGVDFNTVPEIEYFQAFGGRWGARCEGKIRFSSISQSRSRRECFSVDGTALYHVHYVTVGTYSTFKLVNQLFGLPSARLGVHRENTRASLETCENSFPSDPVLDRPVSKFSRFFNTINAYCS